MNKIINISIVINVLIFVNLIRSKTIGNVVKNCQNIAKLLNNFQIDMKLIAIELNQNLIHRNYLKLLLKTKSK